ncbi:hypothetical protein FACS1894190_07210 [Spirochaetia bacterium]|nr:hypothetical protein FACS1894190_07210 [Spirochaetia bacterium]
MSTLKLKDTAKFAGANAGVNLYARMMRLQDIEIDPELSTIFEREETIINVIAGSIKEYGFDKAEPPVIWKGTNRLVDGHTRYYAAKEAGLYEIPVEEKEFESIEDAKLYAFRRQANRRNLTQAEIYKAATTLNIKTGDGSRDGTGRSVEKLADQLNTGKSTIYKARAIEKEADSEIIEDVRKNKTSINAAYNKVKEKKAPKREANKTGNGLKEVKKLFETETEFSDDTVSFEDIDDVIGDEDEDDEIKTDIDRSLSDETNGLEINLPEETDDNSDGIDPIPNSGHDFETSNGNKSGYNNQPLKEAISLLEDFYHDAVETQIDVGMLDKALVLLRKMLEGKE